MTLTAMCRRDDHHRARNRSGWIVLLLAVGPLMLLPRVSAGDELKKAEVKKVKFDEAFDLSNLRRIAVYPVFPITETDGYRKMWLPTSPPAAVQDSIAISVAQSIVDRLRSTDSTRKAVILPRPQKKTGEKALIRLAGDSAQADAVIMIRYIWATSRTQMGTFVGPSIGGSGLTVTHGHPGYTEVHIQMTCQHVATRDLIWKAVCEVRMEAAKDEKPRGLEVPMTIAADSLISRLPF